MSSIPPFHLAMYARDLDETKQFYTEYFGAKITHEDEARWMNIEWFDHQLTFHEKPDMEINEKNNFHWGFNVSKSKFDHLAKIIRENPALKFEQEPTVKGEGTDIERIKMYLKDPNGHLIEIKHFLNE